MEEGSTILQSILSMEQNAKMSFSITPRIKITFAIKNCTANSPITTQMEETNIKN